MPEQELPRVKVNAELVPPGQAELVQVIIGHPDLVGDDITVVTVVEMGDDGAPVLTIKMPQLEQVHHHGVLGLIVHALSGLRDAEMPKALALPDAPAPEPLPAFSVLLDDLTSARGITDELGNRGERAHVVTDLHDGPTVLIYGSGDPDVDDPLAEVEQGDRVHFAADGTWRVERLGEQDELDPVGPDYESDDHA